MFLLCRNELFGTDGSTTPIGFDIGTCVYLVGPLDDGKYELICLDTIHVGADYLVIYVSYNNKDESLKTFEEYQILFFPAVP